MGAIAWAPVDIFDTANIKWMIVKLEPEKAHRDEKPAEGQYKISSGMGRIPFEVQNSSAQVGVSTNIGKMETQMV
ncbi:hypothetical protein N7540_001728 [Penicillium herquei]|nr:hypothetical protein N7540_001728 [Penicillium herquei]